MKLIYEGVNITNALGTLLMLFAGLFVVKRLSNLIDSKLSTRITLHQSALFKRILYYLIVIIFAIVVFKQLGMDIGVFLGAAGIFSVALSFASKTSASNLVSGIFLLIEHPFRVGDIIKVKSFTGTVSSIDLLSTKIKSDDNTLIRIANEELIKNEIINLSHGKIRRINIFIDVPYSTDTNHVFELLLEISNNNSLALKEPKAKVIISSLKDTAIELNLAVWANITDIEKLNAALRKSILEAFKKEKLTLFKFAF